jgi:hypothetical protein
MGAPSSVIVFQPPQASHLPAHLDVTFPQDWQANDAEDFAMLYFTTFILP